MGSVASDRWGIGQSEIGNLDPRIQYMFDQFQNIQNPANAYLQQYMNGTGVFANPNVGQNGYINLFNQLPQLYSKDNIGDMPPFVQALLQNVAGGINTANDIKDKQGWTPQLQSTYDQFNAMFGGNTDQQKALQAAASGLLANGGYSSQLSNLDKTGAGILSAGGQTDQTRQMFGQGSNIVANGGWTPQLQQLMDMVNNVSLTRGMTPEAQQLFGKVMGIVNANGAGGALMPLSEAQSFARDQAVTQAQQQAEAARRQALQLTGSAMGSGTTGTALAENADKNFQAMQQGVQQATSQQQLLQLQQLLGAMNVGGDITKTANQLLQAAYGLGGSAANAASSNLATGAGLENNAASIASQNMITGGNFVNQAAQGALARMGLGSQDMNNLIQSMVAGGQGVNATEGLAAQRENTALKSLTDFLNSGSNIFQGQEGINLQGANDYVNSNLTGLNNFNNNFLSGAAGMSQNAQTWADLMKTFGGYQNNTVGSEIGAPVKKNFWDYFTPIVSAAVGGITGGIGQSLIPRIGGGGNP